MLSSLAILAAFAAVATAQNSSSATGWNQTNINYPYIPTAGWIAGLDTSQKGGYCQAEQNSCVQICGGQAFPNTCDPVTMNFQCKCTVGQTPNITVYLQTIPFFYCQQYKIQCVQNNPTDAYAQAQCNRLPCGSIDPATVQAAASVSAAIASTAPSSAAAPSTSAAVVTGTTVVTTTAGVVAGASSAAASVVTSVAAAATSRAAGNALELGSAAFGAGLFAFLGLAV